MPIDLKKIKSLFIVEEDSESNTPAKAASQEPAAAKESADRTTPAPQPQGGQVSEKFIEVLASAMEKANLPGIDYLEYRQSLLSLEKMPMEESVRYQSAFAMAKTLGATPQKLLESARHYLEVLKAEESKFEQALINQTSGRIGNRREMLNNLELAIRQKSEQIEKLTREIEQHRQEMEQLHKEIQESTEKLESTKRDFIATYTSMISQIQADMDKMKQYLS